MSSHRIPLLDRMPGHNPHSILCFSNCLCRFGHNASSGTACCDSEVLLFVFHWSVARFGRLVCCLVGLPVSQLAGWPSIPVRAT